MSRTASPSLPRRSLLAVAAAFLVITWSGFSAVGSIPHAGPYPDGTAYTPEGWRITPAGAQSRLGLGPLDLAMSPRGNLLLAVNAGYRLHSLMVVDPATGDVIQTIREKGGHNGGAWNYEAGHSHGYYVGVAFSPDGRRAWASSGSGDYLHTFKISGKTVTEVHRTVVSKNIGNDHVYPAGIAVGPGAKRLYVVGNLAETLMIVNPATRRVLSRVPVGHLPYGVALNADASLAFVTNWGGRTVSVVDTKTHKVVRTVETGTHPSAITRNPLSDELYVANADSDTVSVLDGASGDVVRTIDLRPYSDAPVGASPNALAVSPDGGTLYVANAGDNDVAVVNLTTGATRGLIPTAWYPDGVTLDPSGKTLFVTNMKGLGAGPNLVQGRYWPAFQHGSLSRIPVPSASKLATYTAGVRANDHFDDPPVVPSGSVIPSRPGDPTPIRHVIYVMKENRTYDQILGDLEVGNGDPSLALFGEDVTPNHHELARRFVTFDNFYANAQVSADGWTWTTGANANTYNQKNWPLDYNYYGRPYDFGGFGDDERAALPGEHPGTDFLWDQLNDTGVGYRNFGFFMDNPIDPQPSMPGLLGHTDPKYPGWDLYTPDQTRI
jgi:YVTN family beta-propeller protein